MNEIVWLKGSPIFRVLILNRWLSFSPTEHIHVVKISYNCLHVYILHVLFYLVLIIRSITSIYTVYPLNVLELLSGIDEILLWWISWNLLLCISFIIWSLLNSMSCDNNCLIFCFNHVVRSFLSFLNSITTKDFIVLFEKRFCLTTI